MLNYQRVTHATAATTSSLSSCQAISGLFSLSPKLFFVVIPSFWKGFGLSLSLSIWCKMHQHASTLATWAQYEEYGGKWKIHSSGPLTSSEVAQTRAKQREANPALTENPAGAVSDGALDFQISCYKMLQDSCIFHHIPAKHPHHVRSGGWIWSAVVARSAVLCTIARIETGAPVKMNAVKLFQAP